MVTPALNKVRNLQSCVSDSLLAFPDVDIQDSIALACEKWYVIGTSYIFLVDC